jgi:hypothetical protein
VYNSIPQSPGRRVTSIHRGPSREESKHSNCFLIRQVINSARHPVQIACIGRAAVVESVVKIWMFVTRRHGDIQPLFSENQIKTRYIDPGSPWQNGYIESFHSRFRDECLHREWLLHLREARVVIEDWRHHYNEERPHSRLGHLSPEGFLANQKVSP